MLLLTTSLALSASFATLCLPPRPCSALPAHGGEVTVTVDSAAHTVTLSAGPFEIAGAHQMPGMSGHHGMHEGMEIPLMYLKWPVDGWLRGFTLTLTDSLGRPLDRRLLHHLNLINLARRQLFYPVPERTLAVGQETPDILLPKTVGIPMDAGSPMMLVLAWHNPRPETVHGVRMTLVLQWSPTNLLPRPVSVLPGYLDVVDPIARSVDFDLPAGRSTFHADLTLPTPGRIIGIGGHAHDYVTGLALQEVTPNGVRTVSRLRTVTDSTGRLLSVEQKLPGIRGPGIRLRRGGVYRITGSYDNPTGAPLPEGGMLHIILLYAVDDMRQWPALDPDDPDFRRDIDWMEERSGMGDGGGEHEHSH